MTNLTGIQDVKEKIKKLTFEDRNEALPLGTIAEVAKPLESRDIKRNKNDIGRRKAIKNQVTIYLLDDELEMLEELNFQRRKQKIKTDRSAIVGEAIKALYNKQP
jgi:hypothetical protein